MEWNDCGIVLGTRHHGETSVILELMTGNHGRYPGLVRGGRSRKMRPVLQVGNLVNVTWRARLDEHLGHYQVEPEKLRAATLMASRSSLFGVRILTNHLRLLPERDCCTRIFNKANFTLDHMGDPQITTSLIILFELSLLKELGFGLDLGQCVVTGSKKELTWVSPKSGCAVSRKEGEAWASRLLPLPKFLTNDFPDGDDKSFLLAISIEDLKAGLHLTGHFLERCVYTPREAYLPIERNQLANEL